MELAGSWAAEGLHSCPSTPPPSWVNTVELGHLGPESVGCPVAYKWGLVGGVDSVGIAVGTAYGKQCRAVWGVTRKLLETPSPAHRSHLTLAA